MSFCEERLRDVFGWRGCIIFLTHEVARLFFVDRLRDFFGGCMIFVVERSCDFFGVCVIFFWLRGCVLLIGCKIFCVERLSEFFTHSLIPSLVF